MFEEKKLVTQLCVVDTNFFTVDIGVLNIVLKDGVEIGRSYKSKTFMPDQLAAVKEYLNVEESKEISYLESMWTQDVIDAYNAAIS